MEWYYVCIRFSTSPTAPFQSGSTKAVNIGDQKSFAAMGARVDANKLTTDNGTGTDILTPPG